MGGGSGLKYAASTIIYLSKKKEKDKTEVVGNIIKAKTAKSRLSRENKEVTFVFTMMREVLTDTMDFLNWENLVVSGKMWQVDMR